MNFAQSLAAAGLGCILSAGAPASGAAFDPRAFGARGDGTSVDTAAINRAIQAAHAAGGGVVELSAGVYVSGSIHLLSGVDLHLDSGATIEAAPDSGAYDVPEANPWGDSKHYQDEGHSHWHNSLIWGEGLTDVSISGRGRIYGKGLNRGHDDDHNPQTVGNKAIALKNCRNVVLRDFTIEHGGWFGILATGVDNLSVENLLIDTNRDGMDIDGCHNVRIRGCSVNSPWDDGICLKSSFGLGQFRSTENVTISDCLVCGFDERSLLDGTRRHTNSENPAPTGRIKFGTESNGGFRSVVVTNCVFECSRGLALETVDGASLEDVTVSNVAMRRIFGAPIFLRLGARMRGPEGTPVGRLRRIVISNVTAEDVEDEQGILIAGLASHPIEEVTLSDLRIDFSGGGAEALAKRDVPELEREYPEPELFGPTPGWALFVRHEAGLMVHNVVFTHSGRDGRLPVALDDVFGAEFDDVDAPGPIASDSISMKSTGSVWIAGPGAEARR